VVITGLRQIAEAEPLFAEVLDRMEGAEWDNVALLPLPYRSRTVGVLGAFYPAAVVPTQADLALLNAIAGQAAFAVENARLFAEMEEHANEMGALYQADEALHRSLDLGHVFRALVDVVVEVLEADKSAVIEANAGGGYTVLAARGYSAAIAEAIARPVHDPTLDQALRSTNPLSVEDTRAVPGAAGVFAGEGIRAFMNVPITIAGEVIGLLHLGYTSPHDFTDAEQRIGLALSQRAAVAIQNARLFEQAQQAASLEERQRIARDLHDSVSQALYGISLGARTARTLIERDPKAVEQPLDYILSLSEAGLAELRALIFELRPDALKTDGLVAALERQVAAIRARHRIDVDADLAPEPAVGIEAKEALYRVAQEAMTNAIKHAHATRLDLRLWHEDGTLNLRVHDNGVGFDPQGDFPGHLGLKSMRERAQRLGGNVAIASTPGEGVTVTINLPVVTGRS
jgi:signal transduction histidine kinase